MQLAQAALVLALLFVLPGLAWGPVVAPGSGSPLVTAGRAAAASLLVVSVACTALAGLGLLTPAVLLTVLGVLTGLPFLQASRRRAVARSVRGMRSLARGRRAVTTALALGGSALAVSLVVAPSREAVGEALLPFSSTVWYYANLARETALGAGFPAALPEWGTLRPFQSDYLPATAHTAAAFALLPGLDMRLVLEAYRLAVLASAVAVAALLMRRFVSSWIAILGACLLLATVRLEGKFLAYRPETWALVPALFTLWLADRAMVERSWRLAATAAVAAGVTWMAHVEVFLLLGPAVVGLAAARLLVARGRPGLRLPARDGVARIGAVTCVVLVGGMLVGVAASWVLTGDVRVLGYVAGDGADRPPLPPAEEIPPGWAFTDDPTWDFNVAAVAPGQVGREPPSSFTDPRLLPRSILWIWPGLDGRMPDMLAVLVVLLLAPLFAWPGLDARRRRAVLAAAVFGAGLAVGAYLLFAISETYVPMRTGPRRLLPYELVLPVVAAVVLLVLLRRLLRPGWRTLLPTGWPLASLAALTLLAAAMTAPAPSSEAADDPEPGLTTTGYEAYRWIDANLPPDARILTNAYTDGSVAALARRTGIIDGRAAYLEDPEFLAQATRSLLGARRLFMGPDAASREYLDRHEVTHLLVAGDGATGADLGGYPVFMTDVAALDGSPDYTLVHTFGDGRLRLYAVTVAAGTGG